MDPISQIDQLVLVLRQRILERSKTAGAGRRGATRDTRATSAEALKALAAMEAVDDHQLRRALVQNILADQFGHGLVNDTKFQQVVERVTEALESDEGGALLLNRFVGELRSVARENPGRK